MRTPRVLTAVVSAAVLTLTLAACGGTGSTDAAAAGGGSSSGASSPSGGGSTAAKDYHLIEAGTILAATSGAQPPFTMAGDGGQPKGYIIDLTEEAAKRLGLKVEYKLTPTSSGIQGLTAGQYDMVANGLGVTPEREKAISFAKGVYWSTTAALTKKSSPVTSMDGLAGKKVAVITGSVQEGYVKKMQGAIATKFESQDAAVSALNSGTVDAFLVGGPDAEEYLKQFPDLKIAASQPVDHATTVAFQKDNTALVNAFDAQLQAMVDDGTFKTIYDKYFSQAPAPQLLQIWPGLSK